MMKPVESSRFSCRLTALWLPILLLGVTVVGFVPSASFLNRENPSVFLHGDFHPSSILVSPASVVLFSAADKGRISKLDEFSSPILDDIPSDFKPLFDSIINSTVQRNANTVNQGHDSFRYEWGTWVEDSNLRYCMARIDEVRLVKGSYDKLVADDDNNSKEPLRLRVAGGQDWDCLLHVLPEGTSWEGRWPTGSWAMVKTLTGMAEVAALSGPDRDGNWVVKTSRQLRGGTDGSLGGGQSSAGEDCIKYVGGPMRRYSGKFGKTTILEVIVRPPIGKENENRETEAVKELNDFEQYLSIFIEDDEPEENEEEINGKVSVDATEASTGNNLGLKMGMTFDQVGGLDKQLDAIARRVLASRANPEAARKLGVSHVRGVLLSGPPGCGKTLLARELSTLLGAREPQIVNGPEILDKYIGEAEKKVRELFLPAEQEYRAVGDDSALHIIIFDEMDAIARKRGTMTSDTTGVRDSVVNQLLAKMDGVKQASNVLVVGLTNRPELLDPALLRPGRLEVQLRVELPDLIGRRDILRIHTRRMKEAGGISKEAIDFLEDTGESGAAAKAEHFSGAELAGLVRSAASFALARTIEEDTDRSGLVTVEDIEKALGEVRPALGKQDEILQIRYPLGISKYSPSMERILRDLERFTSPVPSETPRIQSLLLVGGGGNGGAGVTALAAWAACKASTDGSSDYVRLITSLDLLTSDAGGGDEARAAALVDRFAEAREMPHSLLVLDDVDQMLAGGGPNGYSSVMVATLRALLRSPPPSGATAKAGGQSESKRKSGTGKCLNILAATSRSDAACLVLNDLFDETIVVPLLQDASALSSLLEDSPYAPLVPDAKPMAQMMIDRIGSVGCKTALRLAERAISSAARTGGKNTESAQLSALENILEDFVGDAVTAQNLCKVV